MTRTRFPAGEDSSHHHVTRFSTQWLPCYEFRGMTPPSHDDDHLPPHAVLILRTTESLPPSTNDNNSCHWRYCCLNCIPTGQNETDCKQYAFQIHPKYYNLKNLIITDIFRIIRVTDRRRDGSTASSKTYRMHLELTNVRTATRSSLVVQPRQASPLLSNITISVF